MARRGHGGGTAEAQRGHGGTLAARAHGTTESVAPLRMSVQLRRLELACAASEREGVPPLPARVGVRVRVRVRLRVRVRFKINLGRLER